VTATVDEARVRFDEGGVGSPRVRSTLGRLAYWVVVAIILVIVGVLTLLTVHAKPSTARLDAANPSTAGAQALVAVLRRDGVSVDTPHTLADAVDDARSDPGNTTVVLYDQALILTTPKLRQLAAATRKLILINPGYRALGTLMPTVHDAGAPTSAVLSPHCDLAAVGSARTVSGFSGVYRITGGNVSGCFPQAGFDSLAQLAETGRTVTAVSASTPFTNGSILRADNAAFALSLFGQRPHLVWYLPSAADATNAQDGVLPIPDWVTLAAILGGLVLIAAGIWRGRRFGPVVVERMPVFVRSSETLEGRARLYQSSSDHVHALDSLRIGAIRRMAIECGLPSRAGVDEVIGAIARVTGRPVGELRSLLLDTLPRRDAELVELSDRLAELEAQVKDAVRPG
jgi:hypothetical protein